MVPEGKSTHQQSTWKQWPTEPRVEPILSWHAAARIHFGRFGAHAGVHLRGDHCGFGNRLDPAGVHHDSTGTLAKQFRETAISHTEYVRPGLIRVSVVMAPFGPSHPPLG